MAAFLAMTAFAFASPESDALMAKEKAAWQSFKDKKPDDFKKLLSSNMRAVYTEGISDMQRELADMQKWDMKSFAIKDFNAVAIGDDTMISTYKVTLAGTYDGKDASGTYNAGSVWKKMNGEWMAIFHANVEEMEPPG